MVKKYIINGGPCAGKTSIVLALELSGELIVRECAEDFIRLQKARGIKEPHKRKNFQKTLLEIQIARELKIESSPVERVFLDGGVPDFFVYYPICGQKAPETKIQRFLENHPYEKIVFFVQILPERYERTLVRRENLSQAQEIEKRLMDIYNKLGYDLCVLPGKSLINRLNQIMGVVERQNGR